MPLLLVRQALQFLNTLYRFLVKGAGGGLAHEAIQRHVEGLGNLPAHFQGGAS